MRLRCYHVLVLVVALLLLGSVALAGIGTLNYRSQHAESARGNSDHTGPAATALPGTVPSTATVQADQRVDMQIFARAGDTLILEYELDTPGDTLLLEIRDPQGATLMRLEGNEAGLTKIEAPQDGTYSVLVHDQTMRNTYDLRWHVVSSQNEQPDDEE